AGAGIAPQDADSLVGEDVALDGGEEACAVALPLRGGLGGHAAHLVGRGAFPFISHERGTTDQIGRVPAVVPGGRVIVAVKHDRGAAGAGDDDAHAQVVNRFRRHASACGGLRAGRVHGAAYLVASVVASPGVGVKSTAGPPGWLRPRYWRMSPSLRRTSSSL